MRTLASIKKDLEFNKGLSSLIEVLKNIAVAQYRSLEHKLTSFAILLKTIEEFSDVVSPERVSHPFTQPGGKPQAVVAVTSDSGLLGGLNMQVVTAAIVELEKNPGQLIVVGERGKMYASDSKIPFVAFPGITEEGRYGQAMQVRDYLVARVMKGTFGAVRVIYPRPVSFTVQKVEAATFLPFSFPQQQRSRERKEVIFESDQAGILEYLVQLWMGQRLYEIFGLSRLAEYAARFVHLEESLQKLKEMDVKERLQYFKVRHELIDRNMRELFSARLLFMSQ